jgi:uncharacterized coiled-coil protein SlyX
MSFGAKDSDTTEVDELRLALEAHRETIARQREVIDRLTQELEEVRSKQT